MPTNVGRASGGGAVVLGVATAVSARAATVAAPTGLVDFLGRFHPFLVHFPVALILAALVAEALCVARRDGRFSDAAAFMVTAAAWVSVAAAGTGFARAGSMTLTPDQSGLFAVHRIAGIATPVLAFLAAGLAEGVRRSGQVSEQIFYRFVLVLAAACALIAGYYGGELVYGAGFFPLW